MKNTDKNTQVPQSLKTAVSKSLPSKIYLTYDENDGEIYAAFTSEKRCKIEAEESGCGMTSVELHYGERD